MVCPEQLVVEYSGGCGAPGGAGRGFRIGLGAAAGLALLPPLVLVYMQQHYEYI